MKNISRTKLLWTVLAVVLVAAVTSVAVFAAPAIKDAGIANTEYAAEGSDLASLQSAMAEAEAGANVTFTLTGDITVSATTVIGTKGNHGDNAGTLTIVGGDTYGIKVNSGCVLEFAGNVTFKNMHLSADAAPTSFASAYGGRVIFVSEGTGTFGDAADASTYGAVTAKQPLSLAGKNLKVYSGSYFVVSANTRATGAVVDTPTIVFGGNATTQYLAGRGLYSATESKECAQVTGKSTLTVEGTANITNILTAGYLSSGNWGGLGGNSELNVTGGTISKLFVLGYDSYNSYGTRNFASEGKSSKYVVNLNGGTINGGTVISGGKNIAAALFYVNKDLIIQNFDVEINMSTAAFSYYKTGVFSTGMIVEGASASAAVGSKSGNGDLRFTGKVDFNMTANGAYIGTHFTNGTVNSINVDTSATGKNIIDDIDRTLTDVDTNAGSTFLFTAIEDQFFGSDFSVYKGIHEGDTTIDLAFGNFVKSTTNVYFGSNLGTEGSQHTGDTTVTFQYISAQNWFKNKPIFGGSKMTAANTEHSGDTTVTITDIKREFSWTQSEINMYGGSNITAVGADHSGNSTLELICDAASTGHYVIGNFYGGSLLAAQDTENQVGAEHSGNSTLIVKNGQIQSIALLVGGSNVAEGGQYSVHSGDSKVVVSTPKRIAQPYVYGGSYLNGHYSQHTGDSTLEFDTTTAWENATGVGYYYAGSALNLRNTSKTAEGAKTTLIYDMAAGTAEISGMHATNCGTSHNENVTYTSEYVIKNNGVTTAVVSTPVTKVAEATHSTLTSAKSAADSYTPDAPANTDYTVTGTGVRVNTPAMRCRAKISKTYFETLTAGDATTKLVRLGMLVGTTNTAPYTIDVATGKPVGNVRDAWAWANGAENTAMNGFGVEGDYYYFQAAVTGYGDDVANLNANKDTTVYFRAYMIIEENGVQKVVYLNNPEDSAQTNYGKTFVQAAADVIDNQAAWLGTQDSAYQDAIYAIAGRQR